MMNKEAILTIRFMTSEEGGRKTSIESDRYGCPVMVNDKQGFDCRFVLDGVTVFELGKEYDVGVKFLNPDNALRVLKEGDEVYLWEGKKIGVGTVKKIILALES